MVALILTSPQAMTAPLTDTPTLVFTGETRVLVSDTFNAGSGALNGRRADAGLGGQRLRWIESAPGSVAVTGGKAATTDLPGNYFAFVEVASSGEGEVEMSLTLTKLPTRGSLYLDMFRSGESTASQKVRTIINSSGITGVYMALPLVAVDPLPNTQVTLSHGVRLAIRVNTKTRRVRVFTDGIEVASGTLPQPPSQLSSGVLFGFAGGENTEAVIDDFMLTETAL